MGIASNGFERQGCRGRDARRIARAAALVPALLFALALPAQAQNPIVTENRLAGTPASTWDVSGSGDPTIQGFATDISVNKGETVRFKINTSASGYQIQIYRLGYYQGNGAASRRHRCHHRHASAEPTQPLTDAATGLVDCGNWAESAHWDVPSTAVSGIYIAKLIRNDNSGASHIVFIVRDDSSNSDLLFKTSDTTWQAYNVYGGNSLYVGNTSYPGGHATMVSYNRPFVTRAGGGGSGEPAQDWLFNAEYPMVRFLEANGYNVTYTTNIDAARRGNLILNHKVFLSVGHDEYWSGPERASVEAARDAGVHMAFFSGNEIYWKTRWANSIDATNTPYRTLVCYKEGTLGENQCGGKCDPLPTVWTGLWRDGCGYTPANDGCRPENALSGQISWNGQTGNIVVPSTVKSLRFWRNTSVASLGNGASQTVTAGTLGYEWDPQQYDAFYPHGRILLSTTDFAGQTHHLSLYRAPSGALVFGAGTVQWSWGLDRNHDRGNAAPTTAMQQATVNLFADMGAQPGSIIAGLSPATQSSDVTPPTTTIVSPTNGASVTLGSAVTISGNASGRRRAAGRRRGVGRWRRDVECRQRHDDVELQLDADDERERGDQVARIRRQRQNVRSGHAALRERDHGQRRHGLAQLPVHRVPPDGRTRRRARHRRTAARGRRQVPALGRRRHHRRAFLQGLAEHRHPHRPSVVTHRHDARRGDVLERDRVGMAGGDVPVAGQHHCEHDLHRLCTTARRTTPPRAPTSPPPSCAARCGCSRTVRTAATASTTTARSNSRSRRSSNRTTGSTWCSTPRAVPT